MSRKVNHLKDELRRTFTIYALIPTIVISFLLFVLALAYWNINVVNQAQSKLEVISGQINATISGYMEKVSDIAALCDIEQLQYNNAARTKMYATLYQYANSLGLQTEFYVYDKSLNRLISNKLNDPDYIELARYADWGIVGQMKRKPDAAHFVSAGGTGDLVVGKAIQDGGSISGYMFFVLPYAQLAGLVNDPSLQFIVKDRYDNILVCSDEFFGDALHKVKPEFINAEGYFSVADRKYYIVKKEILGGELAVYALNSVGGIVSQITNTLIVLVGLLIVLSFSIVVSVKKQVDNKTQVIDQLVEAFSAVKTGDFDRRLDISTANELQIIGEAYNMMLSSLKELMHTNREKARANVISEIKQLESQFNPHFLFNTLENIKFMIKLDADAASKMIVALSSLLRYSIDNTGSEVTIEEDIAYTENYLKIQKVRFGQRLDYAIDLPEDLGSSLVPKLISQPIIENAIKYGLVDCQQLLVKIDIGRIDGRLVICISNNGTVIDEHSLTEIRAMLASMSNCSEHSGLYNVNRRIKLMYGEPFGLDIMSNREQGTIVKITMPLRKKDS